jgi:ankyrin repeat protein
VPVSCDLGITQLIMTTTNLLLASCPSCPVYCRTNATPWSSGEALFQAIIDEDLGKARQLLAEGAPATQFSQDEFRMTPLHYAVDRGLLEMTKLLLAHGADVNSVDAEGNIALYNAVVCEHEEIIPLLMEAKSDVNIVNNENSSIATMADIPESILALLNLPK